MINGNGISENNWPEIKLSEICQAINGKTFRSAQWKKSGLPIIRIQNLKDANANFNYFQGDLEEKFKVMPGDLLFAWSGTPGTSFGAFIWDGPKGGLNQHIFKIVFDESKVLKKYFFHALNNNVQSYIEKAQGGVGLAHITKAKFMNSTIPLPNIEIQAKVIEFLEMQSSRLDAGVNSLEQAEARLKQYRASVLKFACEGKLVPTEAELAKVEGRDFESADVLLERIVKERRKKWEEAELSKMKDKGKKPKDDKWKLKYKEPEAPDTTDLPELPQGWCWTNLNSIIVDGPQNGIYLPQSKYGKGMPIFRIDDFQNNWARTSVELQKVDASEKEISTYKLACDDILVNRVNSMTHIGKCLHIKDEHVPALFESNMMKFQLASIVNSEFVVNWLKSHTGRSYMIKNAKQAVNQASINQGDVGNTPMPLPPLAEQHRINGLIGVLNTNLIAMNKAIAVNLKRSKNLKTTILNAAFTGKLHSNDIAINLIHEAKTKTPENNEVRA